MTNEVVQTIAKIIIIAFLCYVFFNVGYMYGMEKSKKIREQTLRDIRGLMNEDGGENGNNH